MKHGVKNVICRFLALIVSLSFILSVCLPLRVSAYNDSGTVIGETSPLSFSDSLIGGVSAEVSGGTHMAEKNASAVFSMPAEVALLVSALIVVEEFDEAGLDQTFTVNMTEFPYITDVGNLQIPNWAKVTYRDLLSLMLLCRSQDAAAILAVAIGDRYSSYLERMNYKASVLNMSGTYFTSVNGVASPEQTTSFADIISLLEAVAANETLMNILSQSSYTVSESATRLEKSYDSVLPATAVPGMVSVLYGLSPDVGTVYACIDRRDFTTCTAVLFQNQEFSVILPSVIELHQTIYDRYAVSTLAEVAAILAKEEKVSYYDQNRACYIQAVDYSNRVFLREILEKIRSDEAFVREKFSFDYQRNYIYSESKEPGQLMAVADLKYESRPLCSAPLYVSDEVLPAEEKSHSVNIAWGELLTQYKWYLLAAVGAVVLLIAVIVVIAGSRRREEGLPDEEKPEDVLEEMLESAAPSVSADGESEETVPDSAPATEVAPEEQKEETENTPAEQPSSAEGKTEQKTAEMSVSEPETTVEPSSPEEGKPAFYSSAENTAEVSAPEAVREENVAPVQENKSQKSKKNRRKKKK